MGGSLVNYYRSNSGVSVKAICDLDEARLKNTGGVTGNIPGSENKLDLSGVDLYTDFNEMLDKSQLDAVSVTVPTYLHKELTIKALQKGLHVLCEKPMALTVDECREMVTAAEKSGKILQIGHCIRFWPGYDVTKEIISSGRYGKVRVATFQRLSLTPTWSWNQWILKGVNSGGASMDMHIHDADFVQYLFGMPQAVRSFGSRGVSGDFDHIITNYIYGNDAVITAEGGWMMAPGFGFEMSFNIVLEKATIILDITKSPAIRICPAEGGSIVPELKKGDGYSLEIEHFIRAVSGEKVPAVLTPSQSLDSVRLVNAEKRSANEGVQVKL